MLAAGLGGGLPAGHSGSTLRGRASYPYRFPSVAGLQEDASVHDNRRCSFCDSPLVACAVATSSAICLRILSARGLQLTLR